MSPQLADPVVALSAAQRRLWFLARLSPDARSYLVPARLRLTGPLDAEALHRALAAVVRRHDALRMTFAERDGEPVGVVASPGGAAAPMPLVDVSRHARGAAAGADGHVAAMLADGLDLERGPLVRAALLRLAPEEHQLVLCLHHAIADGWALGLVARELAARYREETAGVPVA